MKLRNLLFLDTETTGLDPEVHEIIEFAGILTSPDGKTVLHRYEARLAPQHIETATPIALQVNGYTPEGWSPEKCVPRAEFLEKVQALSFNTTVVAHNAPFDIGFLKKLYAPNWDHHVVDTCVLAWPLLYKGVVHSVSLKNMAALFGLKQPSPHRAMTDTDVCREVFLKLMERYGAL